MREPSTTSSDGATVVITHRVRSSSQPEYEQWLEQIAPLCRAAKGHLDWHIIRPIPGITETYTVMIRFDSTESLQNWMDSRDRQRLIETVEPLLAGADDFYVSSGLDFWFAPEGARAKVPVRWKQYLITWSAIYPLALGVPLLIGPLLRSIGARASSLLSTLLTSAVIVFLMVYVVMPRYTRLLQRWLFA